jgi:monovalent cation:H+ antiporter-2, CPA2 family
MDLSLSIVTDLAVIMIIAAVVVYIFYLLKQPMIIGYLIAGIIIGPYTPPFNLVSQPQVFSATADLGVILLLFGIGLKFPISRLMQVGKVSMGVAAIEIAVMLGLSFGISRLLGWSLIQALFLGTALASSSTAIIAKVLGDMNKYRETSTLIMLGVLVLEDLIVVLLLAIITGSAVNGTPNLTDISLIVLKILAFMAVSLILGRIIIPRMIDRMTEKSNNEVLLLIVLGLVFGLSIVSTLLGFSMAIGAFLMGVIIADTRSIDKIVEIVSPIKDMFAAIFFVSMGAFIDVTQIGSFIVPALLITVLMIMGKMVGCGLGTRIFGYDISTSLKVGLGMGQIGEFAFIVMKAGLDAGTVDSYLFSIIGISAGITTFLTPYLIRYSYSERMSKIAVFLSGKKKKQSNQTAN